MTEQKTKPCTVGELVHHLKGFPQEALVVMSSDEEGNAMNLFMGFDPTAVWDVQEDDLALDEDTYEWKKPTGKRLRKAVILYPEHG